MSGVARCELPEDSGFPQHATTAGVWLWVGPFTSPPMPHATYHSSLNIMTFDGWHIFFYNC